MNLERAWKQLETLPEEAQEQAVHFIKFLNQEYSQPFPQKESVDFFEEPFAGLWKDRVDLKESSSWVRNLRKKEWRD